MQSTVSDESTSQSYLHLCRSGDVESLIDMLNKINKQFTVLNDLIDQCNQEPPKPTPEKALTIMLNHPSMFGPAQTFDKMFDSINELHRAQANLNRSSIQDQKHEELNKESSADLGRALREVSFTDYLEEGFNAPTLYEFLEQIQGYSDRIEEGFELYLGKCYIQQSVPNWDLVLLIDKLGVCGANDEKKELGFLLLDFTELWLKWSIHHYEEDPCDHTMPSLRHVLIMGHRPIIDAYLEWRSKCPLNTDLKYSLYKREISDLEWKVGLFWSLITNSVEGTREAFSHVNTTYESYPCNSLVIKDTTIQKMISAKKCGKCGQTFSKAHFS
jgi:hypothetical protein